ncbi:MAG TPA: MlaD family protein [Solirubrobacteraceae bacterium]|nr:MlaD family protein [Solirubrobacteraceae bacterium]
MQKHAPSVGRILAMVLFTLSCVGLLLFLWLAFGGPVPFKPKGYRVTVTFAEASQLATEADVRISGVPVGRVKEIGSEPSTGRSRAVLQLDAKYAPLPSDTRAMLRQKTLLGETYVELTPGSAGAPPLQEGGRLPAGQVSETVELDEILRTFDPRTRAAFQTWMQTQAEAIARNGRSINDALGELEPLAEDAGRLVDVLRRQDAALRRVVANTGVVFEALTERDGQLRELIENAETVFGATAARDRALAAAVTALPAFEDESRVTVRRLSRFLRDTDPLVRQLRPAARELAPTLRDLTAVAPDLRAFFRALGPLVTASERGFPALESTLGDLRPLLAQFDPLGRQLNPTLDWLALYRRELTSFLGNAVAATQATTSAGGRLYHYLRTTNPLGPENLAVHPRRVGSNRPNPYMAPGAADRLAFGVPSLETRHCSPAIPVLTNEPPAPDAPPPLAETFFAEIVRFGFPFGNTGTGPAPPCRAQAPFVLDGQATLYPHVRPR